MIRFLVYFCLFIGFFSSCSDTTLKSDEKPNSTGNTKEILLVLDTLSNSGNLGLNLRKLLHQAHPGVIQPEAYFSTSYLPLEHFGGFFTKHQFIFIPTYFEQAEAHSILKGFLTEKLKEKVNTSAQPVFYKLKDVFAQNQTILVLIAKEEYYLQKYISELPNQLQETLDKELLLKYDFDLTQQAKNEKLEMRIKNDFGIRLSIPSGFEVALQEQNFIWLRNANGKADMSIYLNFKPYNNESAFSTDSILEWKDQLTRNFIFADKKDSSYMITERQLNPTEKIESTETQYSKYLYGLWKIQNRAMGGSFVSRTVKSVKNEQLYYIEGFVYAPGQEKLDYIRRLEAIIRTLEPVQLNE